MALIPRMAAYAPMRHEFAPFLSLFNDTFNELSRMTEQSSRSFQPRFDVKESKESYVLEGELPGIQQKDVSIEFSDDQTVTIKGHTEHMHEEGTRPSSNETAQLEAQRGQEDETKEFKSQEITTAANGNGTGTDVTKQTPGHTYWLSERSTGDFTRSFSFPARVDQDGVRASLRNGILSIMIPKLVAQKKTRRVEIQE